MKKTLRALAIAALAFMSTASFAQDKLTFEEDLVVVVNEVATPAQKANVEVIPNEDGTINFSLKNFILDDGEDKMYVGNIAVESLSLTPYSENAQSFSYVGNIDIQAGNLEGVDEEEWLGPMLGSIPLDLNGMLSYEHMYATISINLEALGQVIFVELGDKSNFEEGDSQDKLTFEEDLVVVVNEVATPAQKANVEVTPNADGTINFSLKNFILDDGEDKMYVGNIAVENLALTSYSEEAPSYSFSYVGNINIQAGDLEGVDEEEWLGPMLGSIPLDLKGMLSYEHMYATISINLEALGQVIFVELGDKSNFEEGDSQDKLTFEEDLVVVVNEVATPAQKANVEVTPNADGTINFSLKNFILDDGEDKMYVGNIAVENLSLTPYSENAQSFSYVGNIDIQVGDLEGVDEEEWLGPMLGSIPLDLNGMLSYEHMYATISINLEALGQIIFVELGDKSNFGGDEPDAISSAASNDAAVTETYTVGGAKVAAAVKGINIVKMSDGSVKKVLVK